MARSLLYRGLLDQSLDYAKRAREEGKKSGHPATFCRSLALVLPVFLTMRDLRQSDEYIDELSNLSAAHSLFPYRAIATGLKGQWLLLQNNRIDGIQWLKRALKELHAQGHEMLNMDFACDVAAALVDLGEHEQALTLTRECNRATAALWRISAYARLVQDERAHLGVSIGRGLFRSGRKPAVGNRLGETPVRHPV